MSAAVGASMAHSVAAELDPSVDTFELAGAHARLECAARDVELVDQACGVPRFVGRTVVPPNEAARVAHLQDGAVARGIQRRVARRARIDAGTRQEFLAARRVAPAGRSARRPVRLAVGGRGDPDEREAQRLAATHAPANEEPPDVLGLERWRRGVATARGESREQDQASASHAESLVQGSGR